MSKKYIITDWATNILQHNGRFNFSAYGAWTGSPMEFKTQDDAEEYLNKMLGDDQEDERGDYYIEESKP